MKGRLGAARRGTTVTAPAAVAFPPQQRIPRGVAGGLARAAISAATVAAAGTATAATVGGRPSGNSHRHRRRRHRRCRHRRRLACQAAAVAAAATALVRPRCRGSRQRLTVRDAPLGPGRGQARAARSSHGAEGGFWPRGHPHTHAGIPGAGWTNGGGAVAGRWERAGSRPVQCGQNPVPYRSCHGVQATCFRHGCDFRPNPSGAQVLGCNCKTKTEHVWVRLTVFLH